MDAVLMAITKYRDKHVLLDVAKKSNLKKRHKVHLLSIITRTITHVRNSKSIFDITH